MFDCYATKEAFKTVFINPGHPKGDNTGTFWADVNRFMVAAADDLDIELVTLYAKRDHILMKQLAYKAIELQPDYAIIVNEKGVGVEIFSILAKANIPVFSLLNSFSKQDLSILPDKLSDKHIGSLVPDNFLAGKHLAQALFEHHKLTSTNELPYKLLALHGDYVTAAAIERQAGLGAFLTENNQVELIGDVVGNWSKQQAKQKVKGYLKRLDIDIIWAANDPMAIGARQAQQQVKKNNDTTIGGINWDKPDESAVIDISFGGHVALGAKALAMLKDYHLDKTSSCKSHIKLDVFKQNVGNELQHFINNTNENNIDDIDFSRFSKHHSNYAEFNIKTFITNEYFPAQLSDDDDLCK